MKYIFLLFFPFALQAQVSKTIVVEHFTNSRCSVCAAQNPAFFQNLANHPEVKHIAYHPSSPYANCLFSQHNQSENDARTNYYNLYGSTPKLAIQGTPLSNSPNPFSNPNLYDAYQNQLTPFAMKVWQSKEADTIRVRIVLQTMGDQSFAELKLYAAVAEDTVFYNSPNGESIHHNVFRKSFFGPNGITITPTIVVGDSVVFTGKMARNPSWNFSRIFAYALVQNTQTRAMVQADFSTPSANITTGNSPNLQTAPAFQIYPNPSLGGFQIEANQSVAGTVSVFSIDGKQVKSSPINGRKYVLTESFPSGIYWIEIKSKEGSQRLKWVKH